MNEAPRKAASMSEQRIKRPTKSRVWRKAGNDHNFSDTGRTFFIREQHPNAWVYSYSCQGRSTSGISLEFSAESGGYNGGTTNFAIVIPPSEFHLVIEAMHRKAPQTVMSAVEKLKQET